jgi:hypothetical protein
LPKETLYFDDLTSYLLHKNGNFLYRIPFRGGWAVLKVYYDSRTGWERLKKAINNVVLLGQTSYWPKTRRTIERECLELWSRHGFRVFDWYEDVEVIAPNCPKNGYLVCGFVDAPTLEDHLVDASLPLEERFSTYRRFLKEWCRRHETASAEREPRLQHENGDFGHVMIVGDEFLWFDLEMVYRSRSRVDEYLGHEIIQYLWYLSRKVAPAMRDRLLAETVEHYPNRARLAAAPEVFLRHPRPWIRLGRRIDALRSSGRKPTSKYNVARRLRDEVAKAIGRDAPRGGSR